MPGTLGKRPDMVVISSDGSTLYVTGRDENKLLANSTANLSVKGEVAIDREPHGIANRRPR